MRRLFSKVLIGIVCSLFSLAGIGVYGDIVNDISSNGNSTKTGEGTKPIICEPTANVSHLLPMENTLARTKNGFMSSNHVSSLKNLLVRDNHLSAMATADECEKEKRQAWPGDIERGFVPTASKKRMGFGLGDKTENISFDIKNLQNIDLQEGREIERENSLSDDSLYIVDTHGNDAELMAEEEAELRLLAEMDNLTSELVMRRSEDALRDDSFYDIEEPQSDNAALLEEILSEAQADNDIEAEVAAHEEFRLRRDYELAYLDAGHFIDSDSLHRSETSTESPLSSDLIGDRYLSYSERAHTMGPEDVNNKMTEVQYNKSVAAFGKPMFNVRIESGRSAATADIETEFSDYTNESHDFDHSENKLPIKNYSRVNNADNYQPDEEGLAQDPSKYKEIFFDNHLLTKRIAPLTGNIQITKLLNLKRRSRPDVLKVQDNQKYLLNNSDYRQQNDNQRVLRKFDSHNHEYHMSSSRLENHDSHKEMEPANNNVEISLLNNNFRKSQSAYQNVPIRVEGDKSINHHESPNTIENSSIKEYEKSRSNEEEDIQGYGDYLKKIQTQRSEKKSKPEKKPKRSERVKKDKQETEKKTKNGNNSEGVRGLVPNMRFTAHRDDSYTDDSQQMATGASYLSKFLGATGKESIPFTGQQRRQSLWNGGKKEDDMPASEGRHGDNGGLRLGKNTLGTQLSRPGGLDLRGGKGYNLPIPHLGHFEDRRQGKPLGISRAGLGQRIPNFPLERTKPVDISPKKNNLDNIPKYNPGAQIEPRRHWDESETREPHTNIYGRRDICFESEPPSEHKYTPQPHKTTYKGVTKPGARKFPFF